MDARQRDEFGPCAEPIRFAPQLRQETFRIAEPFETDNEKGKIDFRLSQRDII